MSLFSYSKDTGSETLGVEGVAGAVGHYSIPGVRPPAAVKINKAYKDEINLKKRSIDREYSTKPLLIRLRLFVPKPGEVLLFTPRAFSQYQELGGFFGQFPKVQSPDGSKMCLDTTVLEHTEAVCLTLTPFCSSLMVLMNQTPVLFVCLFSFSEPFRVLKKST